jgi:cation transport ATPase
VILLTACPCAIVIGPPLATTCAIAAAATRGLLTKKPDTVELLQLGNSLAIPHSYGYKL